MRRSAALFARRGRRNVFRPRSTGHVELTPQQYTDFRLRAYNRLSSRAPGVRFALPKLSDRDKKRLDELKSIGKSDWSHSFTASNVWSSDGSRKLDESQSDISILKHLIEHSTRKNFAASLMSATAADKIAVALGASNTSADCYKLLVDLNMWPKDTNPNIYRFKEPITIGHDVHVEAHRILDENMKGADLDHKWRRDYARTVFTIDDATAKEIDDGIALDGDWVHVHVADVTSLIEPFSAVDLHAKNRTSSIYLPEQHYPMLPAPLSDVFSLEPESKDSKTLCFALKFADDGELTDFDVFPARVSSIHKITYRALDRVFSGKQRMNSEKAEILGQLRQISRVRRKYREERGAIVDGFPEPHVDIVSSTINVSQPSESRQLVEEFMIAAGEAAAQYAIKNRIAFPFRVQDPSLETATPREPGESSPNSPLLKAAWSIGESSVAFIDPEPSPHRSMGVEAYAQVTSPIRRYCDILAHQQLKHFLKGKVPLPHSSWDIIQYRGDYERTQREIETVQNASTEFWILRTLEKPENRDRIYTGVILPSRVNIAGRNAFPIFVKEIAWRVRVKISDNKLKAGDNVKLKIHWVDAISGTLIMVLA